MSSNAIPIATIYIQIDIRAHELYCLCVLAALSTSSSARMQMILNECGSVSRLCVPKVAHPSRLYLGARDTQLVLQVLQMIVHRILLGTDLIKIYITKFA